MYIHMYVHISQIHTYVYIVDMYIPMHIYIYSQIRYIYIYIYSKPSLNRPTKRPTLIGPFREVVGLGS